MQRTGSLDALVRLGDPVPFVSHFLTPGMKQSPRPRAPAGLVTQRRRVGGSWPIRRPSIGEDRMPAANKLGYWRKQISPIAPPIECAISTRGRDRLSFAAEK